jgi:hypothetical protein
MRISQSIEAPDVFVSYSSADRELVRKLVQTLERRGWRVWWDRHLQPGQPWNPAILDQIHKAKCVLVVWSHNSNLSQWVRIEADAGLQRRVLVPVMIDKTLPPAPFDQIHAGDLSDWNDEAWHEGLNGCLEQVRALVDGSRTPQSSIGDKSTSRTRALDAAVDRNLTVGRPSDLIVMVRRAESHGLREILVMDPSYSMTPEDVRSAPGVAIDFPKQPDGSLGDADLQIKVLSPSFLIDPPERRIRLAPDRDSQVFMFFVTPLHEGALTLTIDLYQDAICRASRVLRSAGSLQLPPEFRSDKHVVSMTLLTNSAQAALPVQPPNLDTLMRGLGATAKLDKATAWPSPQTPNSTQHRDTTKKTSGKRVDQDRPQAVEWAQTPPPLERSPYTTNRQIVIGRVRMTKPRRTGRQTKPNPQALWAVVVAAVAALLYVMCR